MDEMPWPEMYVSFCMKKFNLPPTHEKLKKAVEQAEPPEDLVPRLESIVNMCLVQDPNERAKIVEIFEVLMTMVIEHGALTPLPSKILHRIESNTNNSTNSNNSNVLEPRHVSSVLLSMKSILGSKNIPKWTSNKTFNVVRWNMDTLILHPRSLDYRCGSGLVITLLNSHELGIQNSKEKMQEGGKDGNSTLISNKSNLDLNLNSNKSNLNLHSNSNSNSNLDSKSKSKSSSSLSHKRNSARHPYLSLSSSYQDGNQDSSFELRERIDVADKLISSTSLSTCAKNLAKKSVVNFVRNEGVFHIEISCGANNVNIDDINMKRNYSLKGIERLVLPVWCGNYTDMGNDENDTEAMDELYSDTEVVKSIERLLALAQSVLSEPVPPAILITIVPLDATVGEFMINIMRREKRNSNTIIQHTHIFHIFFYYFFHYFFLIIFLTIFF